MSKEIPYKIYLEESEMPKQWYNVRADMKKKPAPLLNPATKQPVTAEELEAVFCKELVKQELDDTTAYIDIPQEILNFCNCTGLLCKAAGFEGCYHRNWCWSMGYCTFYGLCISGTGLSGIHGKGFL